MGSYTCIVACIIEIFLDMRYYLLFAKQISEREVSNRHKKIHGKIEIISVCFSV